LRNVSDARTGPRPPEVDVVGVVRQDVPVYQEWVAQLNGFVNAEITPKVQGYLLRQDYLSGYFVRKEQLLFEIDPLAAQNAIPKKQCDNDIANIAGVSTAQVGDLVGTGGCA